MTDYSTTGKAAASTAKAAASAAEAVDFSKTAADLAKLQEELSALKDTVAKLGADAKADAAKSLRGVGQTVASAASDAMEAGAEMASSASDQAKTFASEIERMARKNPLGAMAGAVVVGVLIGMLGRGKNG